MKWGIVEPDTVWKLNKAVYGLRQAPKWWGDERDKRLAQLRWKHHGTEYQLQQNPADTQVWTMHRVGHPDENLGMLCVYVDDFLVMAPPDKIREAFTQSLTTLWVLGQSGNSHHRKS